MARGYWVFAAEQVDGFTLPSALPSNPIERIAAAIRLPGGEQAVQLKVAEKAVEAYSKVAADAATTLIVPSDMTQVSTLIASAMKMIQTQQK